MATPIRYPDLTGNRASFQSVILKVDGQEFPGFAAVEAERTRERVLVYGANADPIGKTRGKNAYKASVGVYLAEFNAYMIDHFGDGWGDRAFTVQASVTENGYDTITVVMYGCTIDAAKFSASEGADPLKVESIELNPLKIVWNGIDDNARPLVGAASVA